MSVLKLVDAGLQTTGDVVDISIPLDFEASQPNHFGAAPARAEPMSSNGFTGDTRQGGSCNAYRIALNPHCNGTHTECVGHLTSTRVHINDVCPAVPLLAGLVTVETTSVDYDGSSALAVTPDNVRLDVEELLSQSREATGSTPTALIIRTLPNGIEKCSKTYTGNKDAAFLAIDTVEWLVGNGIDHLLVDLPSIDPYADHGRLAAHRVMFGLPPHDACPRPDITDALRPHATVTELIYVDDAVDDGLYLLNLQIPPFCLDAAPSRPLLYPLERV